MGFVSGLLGTAGGVNGTGISGPNSADLQKPATTDQAQEQYAISNVALGQQMNLVNALQAQNGLQNQSNVYNQLQGVANGTGPNPAQAQLAQATQANTANQAALMAGQRGSGANAGLIARQAAMQGANNQQNAVGQAATLQANQSLNALGQMGGIAGQQAAGLQTGVSAYNQAAQGEQGQILGAIGNQNNAAVGNQSSINSANAGLAGNAMGGQKDLLGSITGSAGAAMGLAHGGRVPMAAGGAINPQGAQVDYNNQDPVFAAPAAPQIPLVQAPAIMPAAAAPAAPGTVLPPGPRSFVAKLMNPDHPNSKAAPLTGMNQVGSTVGKGVGAAIKSLFGPSDSTPSYNQEQSAQRYADADVALSNAAKSAGVYQEGPRNEMDLSASNKGANAMDMASMPLAAKGGKVPALVSPGEQYLPPKEAQEVAKGKKDPLSAGERIPGTPQFPGNDYRNDVVKKDLEPGGLVIPNAVMQSNNPHWAAKKFVEAHMAQKGSLPKKPKAK